MARDDTLQGGTRTTAHELPIFHIASQGTILSAMPLLPVDLQNSSLGIHTQSPLRQGRC